MSSKADSVGARDATAGELASNFSDKVLGNWDTEHLKKPPEGVKLLVGLSARRCSPGTQAVAVDAHEAELQRKKVPGWRIPPAAAGPLQLTQEWTAQGEAEAAQLAERIRGLAAAEGHEPAEVAVSGPVVVVVLGGPRAPAGGLCMNDFILASKLNDLDVAALLKKRARRVGF